MDLGRLLKFLFLIFYLFIFKYLIKINKINVYVL